MSTLVASILHEHVSYRDTVLLPLYRLVSFEVGAVGKADMTIDRSQAHQDLGTADSSKWVQGLFLACCSSSLQISLSFRALEWPNSVIIVTLADSGNTSPTPFAGSLLSTILATNRSIVPYQDFMTNNHWILDMLHVSAWEILSFINQYPLGSFNRQPLEPLLYVDACQTRKMLVPRSLSKTFSIYQY